MLVMMMVNTDGNVTYMFVSMSVPLHLNLKFLFVCVYFAGYDVFGGAEACSQRPGCPKCPGQVSQPHQDHRLWSGSPAGC